MSAAAKETTAGEGGDDARSDEALVLAARAGDGQAAQRLLRRYLGMARGLVIKTGCRPSDIEDILQDATVEALAWLPTLRNPASFKTWFCRIAIFVTRRYARREGMRRRLGLTDDLDPMALAELAGSAVTPERELEARQIWARLDELPDRVSRAARMRHAEGRQIDEIAAELRSSPASVKRYLVTAETALRDVVSRELAVAGETLPARRPRRRPARTRSVLSLLPAAGWRRWRPRAVRHRPVATEASAPGSVVQALRAASLPSWLGPFAALVALVGATLFTARPGFRAPEEKGAAMAVEARTVPAPRLALANQPRPGPAAESVSAPAATSLTRLTPMPADALVEAMGINVRLGEDPQPEALVRARLAELGIRHVIDTQFSHLDWLGRLADLGIRTNLFVAPDADVHVVVGSQGAHLEAITFMQDRGSLSLLAWARLQRQWMEATYTRLKADPRTRHIGVVGATMSNDDKRHALGDVSAFVDFGASGAPSRQLPPGGAFLDATLAVYRPVYGGKPVVIPQISYSTAACDSCVDELRQAKYTVRGFFEAHRRGVTRTYGGYLFDRRPHPVRFGEGMGLARHDGSKKPSFLALERMVRLFSDRGAPPAPTAMEISLAGTDELEHAIYQRGDGTFLLALWLAVAGGGEEPTASVRLGLPEGVRPLRTHRLVTGETDAIEPPVGGAWPLEVTDDVLVVELGRVQRRR